MTDHALLQLYIQMAPFLAAVCGPGSEIVVHDVTDPQHSLVAIEHSVSGRKVGDPMTDLALELQNKGTYTNEAYISGYSGKSKGRNFLSSTYFIKNEGRLIGLLCVNKDMTAVENFNTSLHDLLAQFNLNTPEISQYSENLDTPVVNMVQNRIAEIIAQRGVSPDRMSITEKVWVVHRLNEEGLMAMKGAVAEIAEQLKVSVPTVYRYLNKPLPEQKS